MLKGLEGKFSAENGDLIILTTKINIDWKDTLVYVTGIIEDITPTKVKLTREYPNDSGLSVFPSKWYRLSHFSNYQIVKKNVVSIPK